MADLAAMLFASIAAQNEVLAVKYRAMTSEEMRAMLVTEARQIAANRGPADSKEAV
jgi:hypothetical protein